MSNQGYYGGGQPQYPQQRYGQYQRVPFIPQALLYTLILGYTLAIMRKPALASGTTAMENTSKSGYAPLAH